MSISGLKASRLKTTGLLGGSFNPAHGGHRSISLFAMRALALDETWWLVSPGNPLKAKASDMAPLPARLASARAASRRAPIRATAIEQHLGTRYTIDTLRALIRLYPKRRFVWIMGADNLANFHRWRHWRAIALLMPIVVIARPGYDDDALSGPAMAWLRPHMRRATNRKTWQEWTLPALLVLRYRADTRSASAIRARNPDWAEIYKGRIVRDPVTRKTITS